MITPDRGGPGGVSSEAMREVVSMSEAQKRLEDATGMTFDFREATCQGQEGVEAEVSEEEWDLEADHTDERVGRRRAAVDRGERNTKKRMSKLDKKKKLLKLAGNRNLTAAQINRIAIALLS